MSYVQLDGEKVEFSGPEPASIGALRVLLEQVLAERGRVLAGLWVDDRPFEETQGSEPLGPHHVRASSLTLAEAVTQVGAALAPEMEALQRELHLLACEVLRVPWPEIQSRCLSQVESAAGVMQRAIEVATVLGENSPAARAVSAFAATVERWMELIRSRDAAGLALELDGAVRPALENMARVFAAPTGP